MESNRSTYWFDRQASPYNGIAAAAVTILAWDTNQLFSPGFQFSFVLVLVLLWLAVRCQERLEPLGKPDPFLPPLLWSLRQRSLAFCWRIIAAAVGVSFVSWFGSALFTVGYFHLVSPATVLANIVAVPLAFFVLGLGVCALLGSLISPAVAIWFNNANWLCTKALLAVVEFFAHLPGAYFYYAMPRLESPPVYELTVLDVGSGGAACVQAAGAAWMIDCAHGFEYERMVRPFLRARGVNALDGLILTHGDSQHIGGASGLCADFQPRLVHDAALKDRSSTRRALHVALAQNGRPKRLLQRGDTLTFAPRVRLAVLFPPANLERSSADDKALVLRLEGAGVRVLLMSDAGFNTEQWLLENEPDLRADLLVKGEHGKDHSGTPDFLRRVDPRAIIASGPDPYAPARGRDGWARSVRASGTELFRQEESGAVRVRVTADGFEARGFVNGQTFTSRPSH